MYLEALTNVLKSTEACSKCQTDGMRQLLSGPIHPCMLFNLDKYENQTAKSDSIQYTTYTLDNI